MSQDSDADFRKAEDALLDQYARLDERDRLRGALEAIEKLVRAALHPKAAQP